MMIDRRLAKRLGAGVAGLVVVTLVAGFIYGLVSGDDPATESAAQSVDGLDVTRASDSQNGTTGDSGSDDETAQASIAQISDDQATSNDADTDEAVVTESALVGTGDGSDDDPASANQESDSDSVDQGTDPSTSETTEQPSSSEMTTSTSEESTISTPTTSRPTDSQTSTSAKPTTTAEETTTTGSTSLVTAPTGGKFRTLPPGSSLPSSSQCAARVRSVAENVPENRPYNQTRGKRPNGTYLSTDPNFDGSSYEARIDGNFTGSTDEIIQWAACKWGFDEDILRAQVYTESSWFAGKLGDCNENAQARTGGQGGCSSVGLIQVRSAGIDRNPHPGLFPVSWESSAMNLDYAMAVKRLCFEGEEVWLANISSSYRAGDEWNCMGRWFSGSWADAGARNYIASLRQNLSARPWEGQWVGCKDWRESFYCSGIDRPTVN